MHRLFIALLCIALLPGAARADEGIDALVEVLLANTDPVLDRDLLRGLKDGLSDTPAFAMPKHWPKLEERLRQSPDEEVRELTGLLAGKFGSREALASLRRRINNRNRPVQSRRQALASLAAAKAPGLVDTALPLLKEAPMRTAAIRALGGLDDPRLPPAFLRVYPKLKQPAARRLLLNALVSRESHARELLAAIGDGRIPSRHLTADLVRNLRRFEDPDINAAVKRHWGLLRDTPAERKAEIARYRKLLEKLPRDPAALKAGRELFNLACAQCHTLFGIGGKIGPDITGGNRGDLDYLLQNIIDPNAEIPNDYRTTHVETKDGRSLTGVLARQTPRAITLATVTGPLDIARKDIARTRASVLSLMPEGLLAALNEEQVRRLIAYLQSPRQVP